MGVLLQQLTVHQSVPLMVHQSPHMVVGMHSVRWTGMVTELSHDKSLPRLAWGDSDAQTMQTSTVLTPAQPLTQAATVQLQTTSMTSYGAAAPTTTALPVSTSNDDAAPIETPLVLPYHALLCSPQAG